MMRIIYIIKSKTGDGLYIGSTRKELNDTFKYIVNGYMSWKLHKSNKPTLNVFYLFEKYGVNDCYIRELERYPLHSSIDVWTRKTYLTHMYKYSDSFLI
jgi:hypothetical protein